ncbi:hypothetical protein AA0111_g11905 [Alternaria arborescens]|uniref:hypothetical protein n=1 Tax=Alternaria arborescens TaxID=156630 RepID=UPI0010756D6E|nr:hypothetical protein AA0111_g11905 [Alternaria arborescens]RYO14795.1 hypothetical protein AA0111_g11905 [Alternaria arborescens]
MRFLCFLVLVGLSTASFEQRESNASAANITSEVCKTTTTTTVTSALSAVDATGSRPLLFPTSPSLRLPLPYWDNRTNATRNYSAPTAPSVPFSATSSWKDGAREMLMYKTLLVMAVSMFPAALML